MSASIPVENGQALCQPRSAGRHRTHLQICHSFAEIKLCVEVEVERHVEVDICVWV